MNFWFWIDLIATIPIDVIFTSFLLLIRICYCQVPELFYGENTQSASHIDLDFVHLDLGNLTKIVKIFRMTKIMKMVRITKIMRLIKAWEDIFNIQYDDYELISSSFIWIMGIGLWLNISACLNYYVCRTDTIEYPINFVCESDINFDNNGNGIPGISASGTQNLTKSQLAQMSYNSNGMKTYQDKSWVKIKGLDDPKTGWFSLYIWSFFMAMSQMFCIGYGQFPPSTFNEMVWVMISTLIGAIIWAIVLGNITSNVENWRSDKSKLR